MMGHMTDYLYFSHMSTMCSTVPMYKLVLSFMLDDSSVKAKYPPKDPRELPEDTKEVCSFVSFYYLHFYVLVSVSPSLAGSHQGNLGKIRKGNTMRSHHTNLISVLVVEVARASY